MTKAIESLFQLIVPLEGERSLPGMVHDADKNQVTQIYTSLHTNDTFQMNEQVSQTIAQLLALNETLTFRIKEVIRRHKCLSLVAVGPEDFVSSRRENWKGNVTRFWGQIQILDEHCFLHE